MILNTLDGIAITTDSWSPSRNVAYSMYTSHFVDSNWSLKTVLLDTPPFPERHTAINIVEQTKSILEWLGISQKLTGGVSDKAANMVGHFKHSKAASHSLMERQKLEGASHPLSSNSEVATRWNSTYDIWNTWTS